ncbi:hypothetical protein GALMADRAFT_376831 [Galerina marginata CBS 339.88]|uniref:Uncharacterized protein n=1 Tax=Galerina marginata (strain CBS 339.88) TaxID=685588 RepID=A0A067TTI6_GALM3|nr:hypothetical protein GALMADRAFT_376831 [Galerina marginata CBS 339.88]
MLKIDYSFHLHFPSPGPFPVLVFYITPPPFVCICLVSGPSTHFVVLRSPTSAWVLACSRAPSRASGIEESAETEGCWLGWVCRGRTF